MDQKQTLWLSSLLALTLLLMTSHTTVMTQAAPYSTMAEWVRDRYCSITLLQTEAQEKNCAGAPLKYTGISRSLTHLLCCLGAFSTMEVRHNYTRYLDTSLFVHIVKTVKSPKQERQVARFVQQCHGQVLHQSTALLNDADFIFWKVFPLRCKAW